MKFSALLFLLCMSLATTTFGADASKVVLVFRGAGGCTSCAAASARSVRGMGYKIEYISPSEINPKIFKDAVLWIQPAGNAITAAEAIGLEKLKMIRDFVGAGGGYLGYCAGAFLADTTVDDDGKVTGIGLLPFATADYIVNDSDNIDMVWMSWGNRRRHIFFNGGTTFEIQNAKIPVKLLATYEDKKPAAIQVRYGNGRVVLSGPHPEAPQVWRDRNDLKDEDGSDLDLASELAKRALGKL